jgi:hypothetical protein
MISWFAERHLTGIIPLVQEIAALGGAVGCGAWTRYAGAPVRMHRRDACATSALSMQQDRS